MAEKLTKAQIEEKYSIALKENEELRNQISLLSNENADEIQLNLIKENEQKKSASENLKIAVCIPYIHDFAQGNELQIAMRAWDKNFKENFNLFVIGDKEDWFSDKIKHIPIKRRGNNPPLDICNKLEAIIKNPEIPEKFIWSHDDIYPINPIYFHDVAVIKASGHLDDVRDNNTLYRRNKTATFNILKKFKKPTIDYSTHLPVVYEKTKMAELIKVFDLKKNSFLIQSLYFNYFFGHVHPHMLNIDKDIWKVGVYRKDPDVKRMYACMKNRKFFNHSQTGYIPVVKKLLNDTFPQKCKFEK